MKNILLFLSLVLISKLADCQSITIDADTSSSTTFKLNTDISFPKVKRISNVSPSYFNLQTENATIIIFENGTTINGINDVYPGTVIYLYNGYTGPELQNIFITNELLNENLFFRIENPTENTYKLKPGEGVSLIYTSKYKWKIIDNAPIYTPQLSNNWSLYSNLNYSPQTNFLGTLDNQDLVLKTANTERFRITSDGKVGVNTSLPKSTLDINTTLGLHTKLITPDESIENAFDTQFYSILNLGPVVNTTKVINGIKNGFEGNILLLNNVNYFLSAKIRINHNSASATINRRILTPDGQPIILNAQESIYLIHTEGSWRVLGTATVKTSQFSALLSGNQGADSVTIGTKTATDLMFKTNNTERLKISASNGNIGIGTQPNANASLIISKGNPVTNNFPNTSVSIEHNTEHYLGLNSPNNTNSTLFFEHTQNNSGIPRLGIKYTSDNTIDIGRVSTVDDIPELTITDTGVGIKTKTPKAKLDINGALKLAPNEIIGNIGQADANFVIAELDHLNKSYYKYDVSIGAINIPYAINAIKVPQGGSTNGIGTLLFITNAGTSNGSGNTLILKHNIGTATNRILIPSNIDLNLPPNTGAILIYDYDGWKVIGKN